MCELAKKLQDLGDIARNPNLKGGVWASFHSFISISDDLLRNEELFKNSSIIGNRSNEEYYEELKSIRNKFREIFEFELGDSPKFEASKNNKRESHKFRKKIFEFIQSYKGKFL